MNLYGVAKRRHTQRRWEQTVALAVLLGPVGLALGCLPTDGPAEVSSSAALGDSWYFRGTPNSWSAEGMTPVSGGRFETCQTFQTGDAAGGPRFKIDRYGDWIEAYPPQDYGVSAHTTYRITFDPANHGLTLVSVASCAPTPMGWFFRGTPNRWATTAMTTQDGVTFCTQQTFGSGDTSGGPRFKIDRFGDWSENYPAQDYGVAAHTAYTVCFDAGTKQISAVVQGGDFETLGATYTPAETTFALWSPDSSSVQLWLDGQLYAMTRGADRDGYTQVYVAHVPGDHRLKPYNFRVDGVTVRDPYGKMAEPNTDHNIVMDMGQTALSEGWAPRPTLVEREDAIVYEVHVRDFTIDASAGVTPAKRGKFMGMVEHGAQFEGLTTGIDHLVELGVTHVQIMPFYDFASCPDVTDSSCYNWGYDPRNFNVPEERYSLTPFDYENRAVELKRMVNEFHKAGIRVIMDVVYNHTYSKDTFLPISGQYYTPTDLSGTGNSIDANNPMVSRMIRDSLEYWVREYNIDGFRFDLIGIFDYDDVGDWGRHIHATFPGQNILMYGEPWNGFASDPRELDRVRLGTIARISDAHVGVFNPKFREALKGQNDNGYCNPGDCFAFNANPDTWRIEVGSRGAIRSSNDPFVPIDSWDPMFAADPEQSINYVSAHDNLTLRDKILQWADTNGVPRSSGYLRRIQQFANGVVLTSQGIPFLHGGAELLRDKQGDGNSYNASDDINKYRWQWKRDNADIYHYYRDVIALRRAHPGLRLNTWTEVNQNMSSNRPRYGVVVNSINGAANGDSWSDIIIIYNSASDYSYPLPAGTWKVAMERSDPSAGNGRTVSGSVLAEGTAVTILYRD